ncbi:MAG: hypothetical protein IPL05_07350 [Betaproteobacteria bacterium]|nr:hypothetical protein [Betaproteobacteria bacterium]
MPASLPKAFSKELAVGQTGGESGFVEGVDQQDIDAFSGLFQDIRRHRRSAPAGAGRLRAAEGVAQGNHIGSSSMAVSCVPGMR